MHCFKISSYNAKERIKRQITVIRNTTSCHKQIAGPGNTKAARSSKVPSVRVRVYEVNPSFTPSLLFLSLISIIWNSMKRYVLCYVPCVATISTNAPVWHFLKLVSALLHSNCREIRARTLRFRGASSQNDVTYVICVTRPMLLRTRP